MTITWDPEEARALLAQNCYDGYLKDAVSKLRPKLPQPLPDWEDLFQEFTGCALEAIEAYDPDNPNGAAFTTYLYRHLHIRALQMFNVAWMRSATPENRWILRFSQVGGGTSAAEGDEQTVWDPTRVSENPSRRIELTEFRESLSERTLQLFDWFVENLAYGEEYDVLKSFASFHYRARIAQLTGLNRWEIDAFVNELKEKAPIYLVGFHGAVS